MSPAHGHDTTAARSAGKNTVTSVAEPCSWSEARRWYFATVRMAAGHVRGSGRMASSGTGA